MTAGRKALVAAINNRGLDVTSAAELVGTSFKNMYRWFNGEKIPSLYWARQLEREFGIGYQLWLEEKKLTPVSVTPEDVP